MASAILVTMVHNLLAEIGYSSLVMRQVGRRRPLADKDEARKRAEFIAPSASVWIRRRRTSGKSAASF